MKRRLNIIFLITIIAGSSIAFLSLNNIPIFDIKKDSEINQEKEDFDALNPKSSTSDWVSVLKPAPFTAGSQDNAWNENNLRDSDGLYDSTNFVQGDSFSLHEDTVSPARVPVYTGVYGSTPVATYGDWWFTTAYRDDDATYFYLKSTWSNNYPGTIRMKWGEYQDFESEIKPHIYSITIDYEVYVSCSNTLDRSSALRLYVYDEVGNSEYKTIASIPGHRVHYYQTLTISSGTLFSHIKNGDGFIKYIEVSMICDEEPFTTVVIYIDYVDIYYHYHKFKVDFYYEFDFGSAGLTDVSEFDLKIDLDETKALTQLWMYDYIYFAWDLIGYIGTVGLHTFSETTEAKNYISDSDKLQVNIRRYGYYDEHASSGYQIKVDMIRIDIPPPDPPPNVEVNQGIEHIYFTWGTPEDYGVSITHYTLYRGLVEGGVKDFLGTTSANYYNDTTATVGVRYYYTISASNGVGEGANCSEVSGKAYDQPFIEWLDPMDGDTIIFPYNKTDQFAHWVMFNFKYDWIELDDAELIIGPVNYGSVWGKNVSRFDPYLNGPYTATLNGYNNSILVASDTISITFVRIEFEIEEMLDFGTEIHGDKLYMILHDPHGDESYSGFTETTTVSIGFGYEITNSEAGMISIGMSYNLFGIELGASTETTTTETEEEGFDFRLERSDTTSLTSNQLDGNPDYIGPGYGDVYWGESWIYKWALNATYREYSNNTDVYEDPILLYGIIRGVETLASDVNAPQEWKDLNPVHNNWADVIWDRWLYCDGGIEYTSLYEVSGTLTRTHSFTIETDSAAAVSAGLAGSITVKESTKTYSETSLGQSYETSYRIFDNENTDRIVQGVGIDRRFGSYIFNHSSFFCETSYPLEHHTFDYIPPIVDFPDIDYDSNDDLQGPCSDDSPAVTVDIFDEGGIQEALIRYSIDNGSAWDFVYLIEDINFPGTWSASIPAQVVDTDVQWYIICWDNQGANSTKKNGTEEPFKYIVVSKISTPSTPPEIPGYPLMPIASFSIIAFISIIIGFHKKRRKYYQ